MSKKEEPRASGTEKPLTEEERSGLRDLLANQESLSDRVKELELESKEKDMLLKIQAEEKSAKIALLKYEEKFHHETTWKPVFGRIADTALLHAEEFMRQLKAPEESVQRKKEQLKKRLDEHKEHIEHRHKEFKEKAMLSLENKMAGDFWVLRVEEKHGKAIGEIMTPELRKDKEVIALIKRLREKCENRRLGIILGISLPGGLTAGQSVAGALAVGEVCVTSVAAAWGLVAGAGLAICLAGGMLLYAHWPKIKKITPPLLEKLRQIFRKRSQFESLDELIIAVIDAIFETLNEHSESYDALFAQEEGSQSR